MQTTRIELVLGTFSIFIRWKMNWCIVLCSLFVIAHAFSLRDSICFHAVVSICLYTHISEFIWVWLVWVILVRLHQVTYTIRHHSGLLWCVVRSLCNGDQFWCNGWERAAMKALHGNVKFLEGWFPWNTPCFFQSWTVRCPMQQKYPQADLD